MTTIRVLYADTDMAGVVYHANYLRFFELARTEALESMGISVPLIQTRDGILFTVSDCSLVFHRPAHYGDLLRVEVYPTRLGPARLTLSYEVRRDGEPDPVVTGATTLAALDAGTGRVVRLPQEMRSAMAAAMEERANGSGVTT